MQPKVLVLTGMWSVATLEGFALKLPFSSTFQIKRRNSCK